MQLACWNIQGKKLCEALQVLYSFNADFHILHLQEVNPELEIQDGCYSTFSYGSDQVVVSKPFGCFRPIATVVEREFIPDGYQVQVGHSHLCLWPKGSPLGKSVALINVHFPHSSRPSQDLQDAADSLLGDCGTAFDHGYSIYMFGDINQCFLKGQGSRRLILEEVQHRLGLYHYSHNPTGTRKAQGTRLDALAFNEAAHSSLIQIDSADPHLSWGEEVYRWDLQECLHVDHVLVSWDVLVRNEHTKSNGPSSSAKTRPRTWVGRKCVHDSALLEASVYKAHSQMQSGLLQDGQQFLSKCAQTCTKNRPSLKYCDPPDIVALCAQRRQAPKGPVRKNLSLKIHQSRKEAKLVWRKDLLARASRGDWNARSAILQNAQGLRPNPLDALIPQYGTVDLAVQAIQQHYSTRFSSGDGPCVPELPHGAEADFSQEEVLQQIGQLKRGKCSGPSGVSAELLQEMVKVPCGPEVLTQVVNQVVRDPSSAGDALSQGVAVLLPKLPIVLHPKNTRPIILSEVLVKLCARMCIARIQQAVVPPDNAFGGLKHRQACDAINTVKGMVSRSVAYQDSYQYVQIDLEAAYDSLQHQCIQGFLRDQAGHSHPLCCRFLSWIICTQRVLFGLWGRHWGMRMTRGTVQGGTHSPWIFSLLVAMAFQSLSKSWDARGEVAPFTRGPEPGQGLRGVWYVDDAMLVFSSLQQLERLWPELEAALAALGLKIAVAKCRLMSCHNESRVPPCISGIQRVQRMVYLGVPITFAGDDLSHARDLCSRSLKAYMSNRALFHIRSTPALQRLSMFDRLVSSTVSWSMGTLQISRPVLQLLKVQHTTFVVWLLGLGVHRSWYDVSMLVWVRSVAKLWCKCYVHHPWDELCLRRVWRLLGHTLRSTSSVLPSQMITGVVHTHSAGHGLRRSRTGPDNSHYRGPMRFLKRQGCDEECAQDRRAWRMQEDAWVSSWMPPDFSADVLTRPNVIQVGPSHWGISDKRAIQGCVQGSGSVFMVQGPHDSSWKVMHLARVDGWQIWDYAQEEYLGLVALIQDAVAVIPENVCGHWAMVRMYFIHSSSRVQAEFTSGISFRSSVLQAMSTPKVVLVSDVCPPGWQAIVKAAAGGA